MKAKAERTFEPDVFLAKVSTGMTVTNYQKDQKIFSQGEPADAVFYVQKGKVKLSVLSTQGREAVIAILGETDFLGEGCLAGQTQRMATCIAMSECTIVRLDKPSTIRVLHDEPAFSEKFVSYLLARAIRIEEDLVDQLFNSS